MKPLAILSLACLMVLSSCAYFRREAPVDLAALGEAGTVIQTVVDNYGGADALREFDALEVDAVVQVYEGQTGYVSGEKMVIRPAAGRITSSAVLPGGGWEATVRLDGRASFHTRGSVTLSGAQKDQIARYLRRVLHSVRGPLNLLDGGEQIVSSEPAYVNAFRTTRVEVTGRPELATAYFFDSADDQLRMIAADGIRAGQQGTVAVFRNQRLDNGMIVPRRVEVFALGRHSLVGDQKLLSIEFNSVKVK